MTRDRRRLTYVDFPLPPGGLSDTAAKAWMDDYAHFVETDGDAPRTVIAPNHTETADTRTVDRWASGRGYRIVGRAWPLPTRPAGPDPDRAAIGYLNATVPVHPCLPEPTYRMLRPKTPPAKPMTWADVIWAWPQIDTRSPEYQAAMRRLPKSTVGRMRAGIRRFEETAVQPIAADCESCGACGDCIRDCADARRDDT